MVFNLLRGALSRKRCKIEPMVLNGQNAFAVTGNQKVICYWSKVRLMLVFANLLVMLVSIMTFLILCRTFSLKIDEVVFSQTFAVALQTVAIVIIIKQ